MHASSRISHQLLVGATALCVAVLAGSERPAQAQSQATPGEPPPPPGRIVVRSRVAQGAYVGPDAKLTSLAGSATILFGAQAGWVIDHVLVIGAGGYLLVGNTPSPAELQPRSGPEASLSLAYAGPRIAVVVGAAARLHLVFGVLAGAGRISSSSSDADYVSDSLTLIEPDAAFEASLARSVRLAIGGSYRFTGGTGITALGPMAVNGPTAFLTIKLGVF